MTEPAMPLYREPAWLYPLAIVFALLGAATPFWLRLALTHDFGAAEGLRTASLAIAAALHIGLALLMAATALTAFTHHRLKLYTIAAAGAYLGAKTLQALLV